jgi:hypothetical protein
MYLLTRNEDIFHFKLLLSIQLANQHFMVYQRRAIQARKTWLLSANTRAEGTTVVISNGTGLYLELTAMGTMVSSGKYLLKAFVARRICKAEVTSPIRRF